MFQERIHVNWTASKGYKEMRGADLILSNNNGYLLVIAFLRENISETVGKLFFPNCTIPSVNPYNMPK